MSADRSAPPVSLLRRIARRRGVILGYHGVADVPRTGDPFRLQLDPESFRSQLVAFSAAGFRFVTVAEFARRAAGSTPPPGLAAVSFDDGLRNNLTVAAPILAELGIPATVYVVSGWLGGRNAWIEETGDGAILTADEVAELGRAGWEIGAHTVSHADLGSLDVAACQREIAGSCDALAAVTGAAVQTFAYPFGRYGPAAVEAVRRCGLSAAVTTGSGTWAPLELTRAMISAGDPWPLVGLKLIDGYEPLLRLPPLPQLRRASKAWRARRTAPIPD